MTNRLLRNRLTGIVLLLQVLVAVGGTRDVVLCVGPAGHVAIEDAEAALRCHEAGRGLADAVTGAAVVGASAPCVDTPLPGAALERSSPHRGVNATAAATCVTELQRLERPVGRVCWRQPRPPAADRMLRSIVLLI